MQTDATLLANNSQLFWELLPKLNLPKKKKESESPIYGETVIGP